MVSGLQVGVRRVSSEGGKGMSQRVKPRFYYKGCFGFVLGWENGPGVIKGLLGLFYGLRVYNKYRVVWFIRFISPRTNYVISEI